MGRMGGMGGYDGQLILHPRRGYRASCGGAEVEITDGGGGDGGEIIGAGAG